MARNLARRVVLWCALALLALPAGTTATASPPPPAGPAVTVLGSSLIDGYGRELTLRGFNVSGTAKLAEHDGLPFASAADARRSAVAMRELTGANAVRFLLSWEAAEPAPGVLDTAYLHRVTDQVRVLVEQGFYVLLDYHQDLFSRHVFHADSWYTGDGAPPWAVPAGRYPREFCGICVHWGQNITQNAAVQSAMYDFWHNRPVPTPAGSIGLQDAFLRQAAGTLRFIREHLSADEFARVLGVDPLNEPYAGRYDPGQDSRTWERDLLIPFHQRFRERMDAAGWPDKPAFIEPNMFWDANLDFMRQPGGFLDSGRLGPRFVFNTHFYDQKALSGVFMWGKAGDGQYTTEFGTVRRRAADLDTAVIVSEFGSPVTGYTSDKTPTVLKALYQALDAAVTGKDWWRSAARSGPVLSGTQWQWDVYNGRHQELMNGNPDKVLTAGDAWNGEDFSVVHVDDTGVPRLRVDPRLVDRAYPAAVAGRTLAFTYEDRSRDGATTLTWNPIPATMPALTRLVGGGQYAVLVWRSSGIAAPTELRLPATFTPDNTTVLTDVEAALGDRRLLLSTIDSGAVHHVLVANGPRAPSADLVVAARRELAAWAAAAGFAAGQPPG